MFFLDFFVQSEGKKYGREENCGYDKPQKDGRSGVEVLVDLCRPNERHAPENHGNNACEMNYIAPVFHAAKLRFFEIVFPYWNISARFL